MASLVGKHIGRYKIIEKLPEGGMASVYKAYDTQLEREVAIKFIRTDMIQPAIMHEILRRFDREIKTLAKLEHPNIIRIYDNGEYNGSPYLVMQYLDGGTLKEKITKPIPYQEAIKILLPIARAVEYAHKKDIIHRDIKPANILFTAEGVPMLCDFGIAKIMDTEETLPLTRTGMGIGTPEYMAPEQWRGKVVPQTDIYALGVVFYELITGIRPFTANTPAGVFERVISETIPSPKKHIPSLPTGVEKGISKAMAKEPDERFADMGEFATVLGLLVSTVGGTQPTSIWKKPKPNRLRLGLMTMIGVIAIIVIITTIIRWGVYGESISALMSINTPTIETPRMKSTTETSIILEAKKTKVCLVPDFGGIDDKTFNQTAWKGVQDAVAELGVEGKFLESQQQTDYEKNINTFIDEKCDLIVTVGFLLGEATQKAAEANPNQKFAIVDYAWDPALPNVLGLVFSVDQPSFMAGYLAAGMSNSGKVGTCACRSNRTP